MLFQRFKLSNVISGTIVIDQPGGWRDAKFESKRGKRHEIETDYISDLRFAKEARKFILDIENTQGVNAEINFIFETSKDKVNFTEQYRGLLDLSELREFNERAKFIECPITQVSFKSLFKKRAKDKINLNDRVGIDGNAIASYPNNVIQNTGRALLQEYDGEYSNEFPSLNKTTIILNDDDDLNGESAFYNLGFGKTNVNELEVFAGLTIGTDPISVIEAPHDGVYTIALNYQASINVQCFRTNIIGLPVTPSSYTFDLRWQIDDGPVTITNQTVLNSSSVNVTTNYSAILNQAITLQQGQKLFIYGRIFVDIGGQGAIYYEVNNTGGHMSIEAVTTFRATQTKSYLIHEAFSIIVDSITGGDKAFYSEYLGNLNTPFQSYVNNGEWSFLSVCSGYDLREIDRDYSISFDELFDAINAITPICLSFETIGSKEVVRIEHVSYAFDQTVLDTYNVGYINREVDKSQFFNVIESGFNKWEAENVNGLNEPNGKRQYSTALKTVGEEYKITTSFIAASQVMEVTRRKSDEKTTDTQHDKNIFLLCVKRTLSGNQPVELNLLENDENFTSVTGIIEPSTVVNLRISPTMNMLRHGILINSGLIKYPGTDYKLTSSEGNITMETQAIGNWAGDYNLQLLSEGQDIIWTYDERQETVPLFSGNILKCRVPMSFTSYVAIKNNVKDSNGKLARHKLIQVTDGTVTKAGWIIKAEYDHSDEPVAILTLKESNNSIFGISTQPIEFIINENGLFWQTEDDLFYLNG